MTGKNKYKARIPQQDRGINTKEQIMAVAEGLFIKHGYHRTTSRHIAQHAGVSTGSFYSYFHDKKDVFISVVWKHVQQTVDAMREYLDKQADSDKPEDVTPALIALTMEHLTPELFREVTILRYHDPDISDLQDRTTNAVLELILPWMRSLGDRVRVKDLEAGIEVLIITVMEIVHMTTYNKRIQPARIIRELTDMHLRYILRDAEL